MYLLLGIIVSFERWDVGGQRDPRQLRARIDVDVGRQIRWLVERAHAHEGESLNAAVMTPEGNLARRAAMNDMRSAALGRNRDPLRLAEEALDPVGLEQRVSTKALPVSR